MLDYFLASCTSTGCWDTNRSRSHVLQACFVKRVPAPYLCPCFLKPVRCKRRAATIGAGRALHRPRILSFVLYIDQVQIVSWCKTSKTDPSGKSGPRHPIPRLRASWPPQYLEIGPPGTRIAIEATWCKHASSNPPPGHTFAHTPRNLSDRRGVVRKSASVPKLQKKIGQSSPLPEGSIPATGNRSIDDCTDTPQNPVILQERTVR